jgi:hypothetical protein
MVDNGQDTVVPPGLWKACDKIHGDLGEWWGIGQDSYLVGWWPGSVGEVLVLLANGAAFHILFDPLPCTRPPVAV